MAEVTQQAVNQAANHGVGLTAFLASVTLSGAISVVAGVLAVVWYAIQIYESKTFARMFHRHKGRE